MEGLYLAIASAREQAAEILKENPKVIKNGYVEVRDLAEVYKIEIQEKELEDPRVAGYLQTKTKHGRPLIVVNSKNPAERKRFTIAHELGHYFLHASQSLHVDDLDTAELVLYRDETSSQATHLREIEANQFAAALLMPEAAINKDVAILKREHIGMSEIVTKLAEKYVVSQSSMAIRLNKMLHEKTA